MALYEAGTKVSVLLKWFVSLCYVWKVVCSYTIRKGRHRGKTGGLSFFPSIRPL
jgi:hypothetical protein